MKKQFWIEDFFVDPSRNQITHGAHTQTLAPKAVAVLTYLAEHAQEVVTYDNLLSHVWPDTIVTPNNLQRSVAQLRKALGEDSKQQVFIKTHSKQGYSLECEARWVPRTSSRPLISEREQLHDLKPSEVATEAPSALKQRPHAPAPLIYMYLGGGVVALLLVLSAWLLRPSPSEAPMLTVKSMQALTATDKKEYGGTYTPDGKYILFHRYQNRMCINHIWAKHTETHQETRLTKIPGSYSTHNLSRDSQRLIFVSSGDCQKPVTQTTCYSLMQIDFQAALQTPQSPTELMRCKHAEIANPKWLNTNSIALMKRSSKRWQLIRYSVSQDASEVIYQPDEGNITDFDFSPSKQLLALMGVDMHDLPILTLLNPEGALISRHSVHYPPEISKFRYIYPNFDPHHERLIFSAARRLFALSYQGEVTLLSPPFDEGIGAPYLHSEGHKMLVIKGRYDSDVVSLPLHNLTATTTSNELSWEDESVEVIARSIEEENFGVIQPKGHQVAFVSLRSGSAQIWLANGNSIEKLSTFAKGGYIEGLRWGEDGRRLLVHRDRELVELSLNGTSHQYPLAYPILNLFHWDASQNIALVNASINGVSQFAEVDLNDKQITVLREQGVVWAVQNSAGQRLYMDGLLRFWTPDAAEDTLIEELSGLGSNKRFVMYGNILYGVNRDDRLWSFDTQSRELRWHTQFPLGLDRLTDVNASHLLVSIQMAARKEVVELVFD